MPPGGDGAGKTVADTGGRPSSRSTRPTGRGERGEERHSSNPALPKRVDKVARVNRMGGEENDSIIPSNLDSFPLGEEPKESRKVLVVVVAVTVALLVGAASYASFRGLLSDGERLRELVRLAEGFDCTVGFQMQVSPEKVSEATQEAARRYIATYSRRLRQGGAEEVASSVTKTKDGRGRAVIAAIDC